MTTPSDEELAAEAERNKDVPPEPIPDAKGLPDDVADGDVSEGETPDSSGDTASEEAS